MIEVFNKKGERLGFSNEFDPLTLNNIMIGQDSYKILNLDILLDNKKIDMDEAFTDHLIITNSARTKFFIPENDEDKERGFTCD